MKYRKQIKECARLAEPYCVAKGEKFRLKDYDTSDTGEVKNKEQGQKIIDNRVGLLSNLQEKLYAQDQWAVLLVFQGMDAAGKDGVIKHVMSGVNPQGCEVHAFKAPSAEELAHDFLWRTGKVLPERGRIGIFNRSHYEEVLVVRVHPEMLQRQKLPPGITGKTFWKHRFKDIRAFEHHLARNGTLVLKFHLRISKEAQRARFLARLDEPSKRWKFSMADVAERAHWDHYMAAYQDMIRETSTDYAPWYVVPADHKHVAWLGVSAAIIEALEGLNLEYPKVTGKALKGLKKAERALKTE